jgi:ankyrin repeat protein
VSKDNDGRTSLSLAAENGDYEVLKLLLAKDGGVDPDSRDKRDRTPLSWAVKPEVFGILQTEDKRW